MTTDHATLMRRAAADLRAASSMAAPEFVARWLDASAANAEAGRVDKNALGLALALDRDRTYPAPANDAEQAVKDMAQRLGIKTEEGL